ncbi:MAG: monovalent cation/H+ antiporter subunit D family protein, partial [Pseudomonadota bacterium]
MFETVVALAPDIVTRHAAALIVVAPLILSGLCAFMPSGRVAWGLTVVASVISVFCALVLLYQVQTSPDGVVSYALGGWAPPLGIEFRVDALNALFLILVTGIGLLAAVFSLPTVVAEIQQEKRALFYAAHLICFMGLAGVAVTGDAFNLFVFLEISSIATYVLVALGGTRDRRALP